MDAGEPDAATTTRGRGRRRRWSRYRGNAKWWRTKSTFTAWIGVQLLTEAVRVEVHAAAAVQLYYSQVATAALCGLVIVTSKVRPEASEIPSALMSK